MATVHVGSTGSEMDSFGSILLDLFASKTVRTFLFLLDPDQEALLLLFIISFEYQKHFVVPWCGCYWALDSANRSYTSVNRWREVQGYRRPIGEWTIGVLVWLKGTVGICDPLGSRSKMSLMKYPMLFSQFYLHKYVMLCGNLILHKSCA